ncbi:TPA: hypothetical protein KD853_004622 [Vibrio parahaemolyticus]|uniref:Uncharacterized protein n=1 Tax=Vibrio parahaemolyticus TaxID=670 RepID=A0AA46UG84_VIBPH|nr:hypothetical protein [Vibrio parahaemolyticus]EGQ8961946.1 hypothetical protein [Vibrio parahaemolyticus]EGR0930766.1 hypothetical protein [Vibrio parahaemolyticus]EGR1737192.1 hypothetical protein [Vibrio parahaemolyticus]EGR3234453.1 hypothetical protein [Vibrio parahaemolyticus]EGX7687654.1 hypothetical protein [Vibrio parahaemolyticus]
MNSYKPWHEFIDSEAFKKALDMVPDLADKASTFAARTKLKDRPSTTAQPSQQRTPTDANLTAVSTE